MCVARKIEPAYREIRQNKTPLNDNLARYLSIPILAFRSATSWQSHWGLAVLAEGGLRNQLNVHLLNRLLTPLLSWILRLVA